MIDFKDLKVLLLAGFGLSVLSSAVFVLLGALQSEDIIQESISGFLFGVSFFVLGCFIGFVLSKN